MPTSHRLKMAVEKTPDAKVKKPTFPPCLQIPQEARDSHFPTATATTLLDDFTL